MKLEIFGVHLILFGLTNALNEDFEAQEIFEKNSKTVYEGILQYLTEMASITNSDIAPQSKNEQMMEKLDTLKDTIIDIIEAPNTPKYSCKHTKNVSASNSYFCCCFNSREIYGNFR